MSTTDHRVKFEREESPAWDDLVSESSTSDQLYEEEYEQISPPPSCALARRSLIVKTEEVEMSLKKEVPNQQEAEEGEI